MYVHSKEKSTKPIILDYWMTKEVKENIVIKQENVSKVYTKIDNKAKSKLIKNK